MNFKFKLKGFEVKMKGEGHLNIDEVEVEYTDVKLSEIPGIIKEVRKTIVEFNEMTQTQAPAYSKEDYEFEEAQANAHREEDETTTIDNTFDEPDNPFDEDEKEDDDTDNTDDEEDDADEEESTPKKFKRGGKRHKQEKDLRDVL